MTTPQVQLQPTLMVWVTVGSADVTLRTFEDGTVHEFEDGTIKADE